MKTIYNVSVLMESQEQCDRMKQLCLDYGLPIWEAMDAFELFGSYKYFKYTGLDFFIGKETSIKTLVTEAEFIELLKQEKV
jgi:hypothetical protein